MNREFLLPDVGEGLIEADVVAWKVSVGDVVELNQPLVDIETAKAIVELPSPFAGIVVALHVAEGATVSVGEPLVTIADGDSDADAEPATAPREAVLIGFGVTPDAEAPLTRTRRSTLRSNSAALTDGVRTAPPVRALARERGVDLTTLVGTGPDGVITRDDVLAATPKERSAMKGVRKSMADAMTRSVHTMPQATVWVRVDVTPSLDQIAQLRANTSDAELRFSPLTLVAMAALDAIAHYPAINSFIDDATDDVVVRHTVNLGIAVNTDRGLLVPNVKDAQHLDVIGMARALTDLTTRARAGSMSLADMANTTFTITNVGPLGVDGGVAIVPPGTSAILCVGQVVKSPWVLNDQIVVRDVVELTMTFDHRHIDGALASSVVAHIAGYLREPPAPA